LIAAVGWSSLYRFFFAGRGDIITVTLKANPHMSLGESRSEGKGSATASVLMVGNGVLAVERITSLPLKGGKDVILSGTRFRSPPGITASQRCLDPTRFTTAPQFQPPGQQSSYPLLHFSAPTPLHFSAPPPSPTTTRKETAHSQTFKRYLASLLDMWTWLIILSLQVQSMQRSAETMVTTAVIRVSRPHLSSTRETPPSASTQSSCT
jgi:hypothetical protein